MISDFCRNGLYGTTYKGDFVEKRKRIPNTREFDLGSWKNGSVISLELRLNPDSNEGSLLLIIPDVANHTIAKNLSGEYVWFAQTVHQKDKRSDITIIDGL